MRPGVLLVRASLELLVMVFIADDLPAFDLPANATSLPLSVGHCVMVGALNKNLALL